MSTTHLSHFRADDWWGQLGLRYEGMVLTSRHERRVEEAVLAVLREHPPVAFAGSDGASPLSLEELGSLIQVAAQQAERGGEEARARAVEARRIRDQAQFESAYAMPDAHEVITDGRWAEFPKGEAFAWCWTLFQYEPHGFMHPGTQVRHEAMQQLEGGVLPTVFGYPERARGLADRGLDPLQYRLHQDALGAKTFDPSDVRHR